MKKFLSLLLASACIVLIAVAKDFVIQLKSGEEARIPVENIKDIRFDENSDQVQLPEDPYPTSTDFTRKVLLTQHTGTNCGYCPKMVMALRTLAADEKYEDAFTLAALHSYDNDPMGTDLIREVSKPYVAGGYPYTNVNWKGEGVGALRNYTMMADRLKSLIDGEQTATVASGIASMAKINESTIDLTIAMKAGENGRYRVGAMLIEDGIKADQTNYDTDLGGEDFNTHNNVVRTLVGRDTDGGFTGVNLGAVQKGAVAYTTQTITIKNAWKMANSRLLIYVAEKVGDRYVCVNSAYAPVDGELPFKYDSGKPGADAYVLLKNNYVEAEPKGAYYSVEYTMAEGATGVPEVSTECEWIEDLELRDGEIRFHTAANETAGTRSGRILVAYGDARPIAVTVRQKSMYDDEDALFKISVDILTPYKAMVQIVPNGYTGNYLFFVAKCETVDKYINAGNLEGWIEGDLDYLQGLADYYESTLEDFLPNYPNAYAMNGATTTMTYTKLTNDTDYYIYCYGLTPQGEVTTDFYKKKFTTTPVDKVDLSLSLETSNITQTSADLKVIPSNNDVTYFWTYVSEMDWTKYDLNFIMDNMVQNVLEVVASGADINTIIHRGPSGEKVKDLWKGTRYHLVGWGMDEMGTPTTSPMEFGTFTTLPEDVTSNCTFKVDFPVIKDNDMQIHIVPSDNSVRYYTAFVEESKCVGYDKYQMAQRIINMEDDRLKRNFYGSGYTWANIPWMYTGEQTLWGRADLDWTFSPNRNYNIYVFGVDGNGKRTTDVCYEQRTTLPAPESDMTIEMIPDEITYNKLHVTFKPSNNDEYYIPLLVSKEEMQYVTNPDGTLDEQTICEEIEHYYDDTPNYYTMKGEVKRTFNVVSETEYTLLVCGWSGGNTTHFFTLDFTTPKIPFGESKADVKYTWELFDGAELAELDWNRWKEYTDFAVFRVRMEPNEYADYYTGGIWMPEDSYLDLGGDDYLLHLIQLEGMNITNEPEGMYRTLSFGVSYSFSAIAKDKDGKLGPWHYEVITPKRGENMTPAYDFWTKPDKAPTYVVAVSPDGKMKTISAPSFEKKNVKADADRLAPAEKAEKTKADNSLGRN